MSPAIVLGTVNAPYSIKLDAQGLANCLLDPAAAKKLAGQMSAFFGEIDPSSQIEFASHCNISKAQLVAAAKAFAAYSGESYLLAA